MIRILLKYRYFLLLIVIVLTITAVLKIPSIQLNSEFLQFLPENDEEYLFYKKLNSEIQDDEYLLLIGVKNENTIFDTNFLQDVQTFSDSLNKLTNVKNIKGLTNLSYPYKTLFGFISVPYLKINKEINLKSFENKVFTDFEFTQHFINKNGTAITIWLEIKNEIDDVELDHLLNEINIVRTSFPKLHTYLWGRKYLESTFKKSLSNEIEKFILWVVLFLIVALIFIFKKPIAIIFPVLLVLISIIIFLGGMAYLDRPLGLMSNLFPTIILIVGISDVIHIAIKYQLERSREMNAQEAAYITLKEIGWTTFITSFTTAVGFFILYLSPMKALRDFGIEAGAAVLITFVLTFLIAPVFLINSKQQGQFFINKKFNNLTTRLFKKLEKFQEVPKQVIFFYSLLLLIGIVGVFFINTNNLQFSISKKSDLMTNYTFFENNSGGSRTFELILQAKGNEKLNKPDILKTVNEIHNYLDSLPYLSLIKSPIINYRLMHKIFHPSSDELLPEPMDEKTILKYEKQFFWLSNKNYLANNEQTIYKFKGQMKDLGRHTVSSKNKEIIDHLNVIINSSKTEIRISGLDFLFDRAHKQRINNMFYGLIVAVIIVSIVLGVIFKNIVLMLLALILNFIPIIISAGIMGFTNFELRSGTSIIFTIGFVIAVDNTIHLLSKFQFERKKGGSVERALHIALRECGKAIVATSIILIGGFFILMFSDFMEIFVLGLFVGIIVLIALSVDLILAPVLILTWFKKYL